MYWMMWPVDPESEGSPSESREAIVVVMITPTVVAMATPARNGKETLSALGAVTKIIADMICGPAIIVMASGRICRFMTLAFFQRSGGRLLARPARSGALALHRLCERGYLRGAAGR